MNVGRLVRRRRNLLTDKIIKKMIVPPRKKQPQRPFLAPQYQEIAPTIPPSHQIAPATRRPGYIPPPVPPDSYHHPHGHHHHGYLESHALGPTTR